MRHRTNRTLVMRSRILTACGSGVAFLWDVRVSIDRSHGIVEGSRGVAGECFDLMTLTLLLSPFPSLPERTHAKSLSPSPPAPLGQPLVRLDGLGKSDDISPRRSRTPSDWRALVPLGGFWEIGRGREVEGGGGTSSEAPYLDK